MLEENKLVEHEAESDRFKSKDSFNDADKKEERISLKNITQIVYICQSLSFLFGITAIIGVIINYLKRNDVKGTWLESHFSWQIRTFWVGLLLGVAGWVLTVILIGFLILAIDLVWVIYRVVKGWLLLCDDKPIKNSMALI